MQETVNGLCSRIQIQVVKKGRSMLVAMKGWRGEVQREHPSSSNHRALQWDSYGKILHFQVFETGNLTVILHATRQNEGTKGAT